MGMLVPGLALLFFQDRQIDEAIVKGVALLIECQEGDPRAEWPYEGVYRVSGKIPVGYRIGGTSICATALLRAPGDDKARREAIDRAAAFVIETLKDPLMGADFAPAYDVRGWGHASALSFLLALDKLDRAPKGSKAAIDFCVSAIEKLEMPENGGWSYASAGSRKPAPPSTFMTAVTLQALWQAKAQGYKVDAEVLSRAVAALERARLESGAFQYSGTGRKTGKGFEAVEGSIARSPLCETTLLLAGKSDAERVRKAVDAFFEHWEWLEKRRRQNGTHMGPYAIAPYYFYFGHMYAGQAIEFLPEAGRPEYRKKLAETLFKTRDVDGSWNDRVFSRSKNYGTACALLALLAPKTPLPAAGR
jgi:hypothetical protein